MIAPSSARLPVWLQSVLVFALTGVAILAIFHRSTWADWSQPHWLEGDPLEVYARIKIASEQPRDVLINLTSVDAFGAPARADWQGYPTPDRLVFFLAGTLSRGVGLIAAVQLMSAFILGLNAVTFYLCARWLRWRWEWAVALAVAFALCTYNLRWGITLSFNQTFTLPPLILLCARAARRGVTPSRGWTVLAIALGLWFGQGNPYLAYFSGIVAGGALVLAVFRRNRWGRVSLLLVLLGALLLSFLAANASHIRHILVDTDGPALVRSLDDVRTYSLRPADWLVPPADHRLAWLAELGRNYHSSLQGHGEFFYNYLGLLGLVALLGLIASKIIAFGQHRWTQLDALLGLCWITAFGVVGGLNYWLGVAGFDLFRASTRIGIFAQAWVFLFLGGWLTRRTQKWPFLASGALALVLGALSIWDQTPPLADAAARQPSFARWNKYQELTSRMEQTLPKGATVFQLPVVPFPEAGKTGAMPDYEHVLPYLTSSSLRFSYGQLRPSPVLRWARHAVRQPVANLLATLQRAGFSALWIDPRAYTDGAVPLIEALKAAGYAELTSQAEILPVRVFQLTPASTPQMPDFADPRLQDPWDETAAWTPLFALRGWYGLEKEAENRWRWAGRQALLGIWSDKEAASLTLRFRLGGPSQSTVIIKQAGHEIWRASPGNEIHRITVPLASGLNILVWELKGNTFRPGDADPRELGFMVENLTMSVP